MTNPLFQEWNEPTEMPPFSQIRDEHYEEAFTIAIEKAKEDILRIAELSETPTFENTIDALEKSGKLLDDICSIFFNISLADTTEALQKIELSISPVLAKHESEIFLNQKLSNRVSDLWKRKEDLALSDEQIKVLERYEKTFRRTGAHLDEAARTRMNEISQRSAEIMTLFSQNVLKNEADYQLVLEHDDDLQGLPDFLINSAERAGTDLGKPGQKIITLARSSVEPFLQFSARRDLREKVFKAWVNRGALGDETDNKGLIAELVSLRDESAKLLGFKNFADFQLDDQMAKNPETARDLLLRVWNKARVKVDEEKDLLLEEMVREGINDTFQPWDWRYYAEKVRKAKYDLNDADIKPYFQLDNIIEATFYVANRLFGLSFQEVKECERYHPDVRVWDVKNEGGKLIARFLGDYFARPSKRGGAWMSNFRSQQRLSGEVCPIIINVLNLVKGAEGEAALLTFDDARTIFHEFGHALHGMLSDVTYPTISGTNVVSDFVELPSQLYEHWLSEPEVLQKYAVHVKTGEVISEELQAKIKEAMKFNQGFMTTEYLSCALVDLKLHETDAKPDLDIEAFEANALKEIDMPDEIVMRHRLPHFQHLFAGDGYSAGYYSYMWSEVMDCDAFKAFEEKGDVFDRDLAVRLKKFIYSSGGSLDPEIAYQNFRGRQPNVDALLEKRGLK